LRGELEKKMAVAGFWDNQEAAQGVVSQLSAVKSIIEPVEEVGKGVGDLAELFELASEEGDGDVLASVEADMGAFSVFMQERGGRRAATGRICCCVCIAVILSVISTALRNWI
jgi:hypothetical protein